MIEYSIRFGQFVLVNCCVFLIYILFCQVIYQKGSSPSRHRARCLVVISVMVVVGKGSGLGRIKKGGGDGNEAGDGKG